MMDADGPDPAPPPDRHVPLDAVQRLGNRLGHGVEIVDVLLLPSTYGWPRRLWTFLWWRVPPFRWVTRGLRGAKRSPYRTVMARVRFHPSSARPPTPPDPAPAPDPAVGPPPRADAVVSSLFRRRGA